MRAKIVALLLSGALLAGAQGAAATAGGATVVWQNPKLTVTRGVSAAHDHVQEPDRSPHQV
jgi:hypothetical protein